MTELDFTADDWFYIRGRGHVASFANGEQLPKGMSARDLRNRYVIIDGKEYWVTGVETPATYTYSRIHPFALLIRGER
jgi:hypothetical protein